MAKRNEIRDVENEEGKKNKQKDVKALWEIEKIHSRQKN